MSLLCVDDLNVRFETVDEEVRAVRDLNFRLEPRESLGIVGESGSGKSQAMAAVLGLLAENGTATGSVRLDGEEILNLPEVSLRKIRGRRLSIVFQDPMTSLNPYLSIGYQMCRVLVEQRGVSLDVARNEVVRMLDAVKLPAAKSRLTSYPHEYSGGMRQRVMIAAAMLCRPDVLIADEPTTALDVTVQASILDLLRELQTSFRTALILITHDLGVVAGTCDRLMVMDKGSVVEEGTTEAVFANPAADVTKALIEAVPRIDRPRHQARFIDHDGEPLLKASGIRVRYPMPTQGWLRRRKFSAVRGVDLSLYGGETLGIVGESGCGKSSLARALLNIGRNAGDVSYLGQDIVASRGEGLQRIRRDVQFVFQDPLGSLDPRMTIEQIVEEPALVHRLVADRDGCRARVIEMLERVGLDASTLNRYPHEFSGGQCQRVGIARALITRPRVIICDEAVSALDVTVQASILKLLAELQREFSLGVAFIAHDLAVVRDVSDRVMVMYLGRVVEEGPVGDVYESPRHPYTRALLDAAPLPDPRVERQRIANREPQLAELPAPWNIPAGCAYASRCPHATDLCREQRPALNALGDDKWHRVACHYAGDLDLAPVAYSDGGAATGIGMPLTVNKPSA
ncbi:MAG: ABC transporter ATP-binding protein [Pseudomonadota bacterium]